jgi:hypothetical protein
MDLAIGIIRCDTLDVAIWLLTNRDPSAAEWAGGVARLAELKQLRNGDLTHLRCLTVTDGGAPNARQRGELFTDLLECKVKAAQVTFVLSNPFNRGRATAISWLNPLFQAYTPEKFLMALKHLDLGAHYRPIFDELRKLQTQLTPNETLRLLPKPT